uniref:Cas scaffold protein family member 4 n=1 Tax=Danio rerio TaxID=7955 RepID=E7FDH3_DANRE|nr:cas scaffolding protein family member 4 [Danio rerio]|eukprot:XP_001341038.2 cas scaffolding protein family member 4 [Danio rerio]
METLFARALYANTAETEDELAFCKGEIILVLEKNVVGSTGWWKCALRGRQGLAPANRLAPLSPAEAEQIAAERDCSTNHSHQSIYQTPIALSKSPELPIYEDMKTIYKVPPQGVCSPNKQEDPEGTRPLHDGLSAHPKTGADIYDVPNLLRKSCLFTASPLHPSETSLMSSAEFHSRNEATNMLQMLQNVRCETATNHKATTLPPFGTQDPNYDFPVPSITEDSKKPRCGYSTMPNPCKSEWIYDVPVFPQKQGCEPGYCDTLPPKDIDSTTALYDILPARIWPEKKHCPIQPLYDVPKPSISLTQSCTVNEYSPISSIYDVPPCFRQTKTTAEQPRKQSPPEMDSKNGQEPLEYRGKPGPLYDQLHRWPSRGRTPFRQPLEGTVRRDNEGTRDHQRSSTVSTSSTASSSSRSSCDSFMLSSPEPEPLREITLSQEEAGNKLLELKEAVCQSVPKLMLFVSSQWRSREHLGQHLDQIRTASEDVTDSIDSFLNFTLDVRGNAQRLTDSNLQTRLLKQLSIVEDSGLILQQAASALRDQGWHLEVLAQDAGHSQMPDHLERFVMVARTVPEDVKRLVSMLNANGKLLFRVQVKELEVMENEGSSEGTNHKKCEPMVDSGIDESDYVQLQTTAEIEQEPKPTKSSIKSKRNSDSLKKQVSKPQSGSPCNPIQTSRKCPISDHCRLYFGAIQKAISVFISSLNENKPPEQFISHSKLVIMVGQRLVNTLCSEAKSREAGEEMLAMSNQLCAQLKQLALVTKKAALNFPDKLAVQEAHDIAKELAQRAQHFRTSLDV